MSFIIFCFIGDILKQFYFPVLIPIGTVGNVLSFLVRTILVFLDVSDVPLDVSPNSKLNLAVWN